MFKNDLKNFVGSVTPYVPYIGLSSGLLTIGGFIVYKKLKTPEDEEEDEDPNEVRKPAKQQPNEVRKPKAPKAPKDAQPPMAPKDAQPPNGGDSYPLRSEAPEDRTK